MTPIKLNGVNVYPFTSVDELIDYAAQHQGILVAINAEKILHATAATRAIINRNIGYCDGAGAQMALKRRGYERAIRIPGVELWLKIVARYYKQSSFYLIGGRQEVIEGTAAKLRQEFKGINIVGQHNGFFSSEAEQQTLIDDVVQKHPKVVLVAMGSPKQELLMERMRERHKAIYQGLGGSFDVYTGHVARAPRWWSSHNLEFAYRLLRQPKRIKRQIHLVKFAWWLWRGKL